VPGLGKRKFSAVDDGGALFVGKKIPTRSKAPISGIPSWSIGSGRKEILR
jgi:hypothetical protein